MILVTGGTGFIGSNILAALNESGHDDLVIVDELGTGLKWRNIAKRRFADFVFPKEIHAFLDKAPRIDAVIHMGANSSTTATDGDEIIDTNFRLSSALWIWCTRHRVPLVYASSAATYGDGAEGFRDTEAAEDLARLRPLNLYGWTKHAFDRWALAQAALGHAPPHWAGLKFFNVFGPNEYHKGSMQSLVAKNYAAVAAGRTVNLFKSHVEGYQDGEQLRDFVYVKDCCDVVLWLLAQSAVSGLFNVGTGRARSFHDLMRALGRATGTPVDIAFVDMPENIRDQYQYFTEARMEKLRGAGFPGQPTGLEQAVNDYVKGYLSKADPYR